MSELDNNLRLDKFISKQCPQFSRAFVQKLINEGYVVVNGKIITKASYGLKTDYVLKVNLPEKLTVQEKESLIKSSGTELIHEDKELDQVDKKISEIIGEIIEITTITAKEVLKNEHFKEDKQYNHHFLMELQIKLQNLIIWIEESNIGGYANA